MSHQHSPLGLRASHNGLYTVHGGTVIEGDYVTPTRIVTSLLGSYNTFQEAQDSLNDSTFEYEEIRVPANYLARHTKLAAIKAARQRQLENDPTSSSYIPF